MADSKDLSDYSSEYDSDDPCAGRACDMGWCRECDGHTSGGGCLREGCDQDCCMEYEECCCDCMRCGGISEPYLWCIWVRKESETNLCQISETYDGKFPVHTLSLGYPLELHMDPRKKTPS